MYTERVDLESQEFIHEKKKEKTENLISSKGRPVWRLVPGQFPYDCFYFLAEFGSKYSAKKDAGKRADENFQEKNDIK